MNSGILKSSLVGLFNEVKFINVISKFCHSFYSSNHYCAFNIIIIIISHILLEKHISLNDLEIC